jgi:Ca-activated chloride channel family protein
MSFLWPSMLLSLIVVPAAVGIYILQRRRARRASALYGGFGTAQQGSGKSRPPARHLPWILLFCGLAVFSVAMARPQATLRLPRLEGTVVLAFDVSGSMAADDAIPSRMEAAKAAARSLVEQQPDGVAIGVVTFSDTGFTVQTPTHDRDSILAAINRISPTRGTSLANGILIALNAIDSAREPAVNYYSNLTPAPTPTPTPMPPGQYSSASIVLLSDGENNERPDPSLAAQAAADRGVRIYTIGVGTAEGAILHVEGLTVRSRLEAPLLQQIADLTGGAYFEAPAAKDWAQVYNNLDPELLLKPEKTEVTAILAGVGTLFLLAGAILSLFQVGRAP